MLPQVLILRSSSGSIHCSLLTLNVKMLITLLHLSVMQQHIVCMLYPLQGSRSTQSTYFPATDRYNIYTYTWYYAASPINVTK